MGIREFELSNEMEREFEILRRVSGLSDGELIRIGISILRLHVEAVSEGREIIVASNATNQKMRFTLPFELREPYNSQLRRPTQETWWQRLLRLLHLR